MTLLRFDDVSLAFGDQVILSEASMALEDGERVCLVGRNGAGKTTLLRLIAGTLEPDAGEVERRQGLVVSRLEQALPGELEQTAREFVAGALGALRAKVAEYETRAAASPTGPALAELEALQREIEAADGWRIDQRVDTVLSELELPADRRLGELSGGWRRRVALARALVTAPELLLLDEPTNHLDLATIAWLEQRVRGWPGTVLFVTHDRAFLQAVATRIVEVDRGRVRSWPGTWKDFLRRRAEADAAERRANELFDKRLADEEAWIRQGVKARGTRNQGRVRALTEMRETRAARLGRPHTARINIDEADPSGRKVITARNVGYGFGDTPLVRDFSVKITRGDRIGLVGNNGVGKSTLLRLLLGELEPQTGTIKRGTNVEIAYFDQTRRSLDPAKTVAEIVGEGRDYIRINGKERHVVGYLRGFLFSAKRAMTPVGALSGGERNRVILARLFTRPSNLLVLDEPTNDLDVETLEALEARLAEYEGTLIVVSHDRAFLDNVVERVLVFEADGLVREYHGGWSEWARRGRRLAELDDPNRRDAPGGPAGEAAPPARGRTKLSYKEQRELNGLPARIDALERATAALHEAVADPGFYARPPEEIRAALEGLAARSAELESAVERWGELEELREQLARGA